MFPYMHAIRIFSRSTVVLPKGLLFGLCCCLALSACGGSGNDPDPGGAGVTPTADGGSNGENGANGGNPANGGGGTAEPLPPLPATPASPAPGADDEPTPVNRPVTSITRYFLVEDPPRRIEPKPTVGLTDADFAAGLPAPVLSVPDGIDPETNPPPYFVGLENQEIEAGQLLEIIYQPLDGDGSPTGMFPNERPEGASFDDNFDSTKTFRWRPLQGDIGIVSFTVTALDNENNAYQSAQALLIKVIPASDPSSIPNFPPQVDAYRDHTVRVGDPVVLELKGTDRNATYPTVEVPNPPPGAAVTQHYIFDEISVLRFIPQTAGSINIDVVARDSEDPRLTGTGSVTLEAKAASAFTLPGKRLRALAGERDFLIGFAALQEYYHRPDGAVYADIAGLEFNIVSTENSMKWSYINPVPGQFRWADADNLVSFAKHYNHVIHAHPLIWHRQLPIWIKEAPSAELETHMREFIHRMASRYGDDVAIWDVINEPIADEGGFRPSLWYQAMGDSYIDIAFRQARESDPDGILLLNEFDIAWDTPKT